MSMALTSGFLTSSLGTVTVRTPLSHRSYCFSVKRIQYAKTKSDVIAKADGTFVPREKRKKHDDRGKKKKEQHDANQAAMGLNPTYAGAYGAAPPVRIQIKENFIPYFH